MSTSIDESSSSGSGRPVPVSSASSFDSFSAIGLSTKDQPSREPVNSGIGAVQRPIQISSAPMPTISSEPSPIDAISSRAVTSQLSGALHSPDMCSSTTMQVAMQPSLLAGNTLYPGSSAPGSSVPEFLYQLTKMLTEDNREVIEWSNGLIKVHNPGKLESHVLHKYFRHSKFSSFQRQLNYFGFRKLAGKGKMAPCSYANESAGQDIRSLLFIKVRIMELRQHVLVRLEDSLSICLNRSGRQAPLQARKTRERRKRL